MFNLKEKKEKRDRVIEMIGDMGVRVREEEIVDVVRMRKKDEGGLIRPIIVEFRTEYDKWTVLTLKLLNIFEFSAPMCWIFLKKKY